MTHTSENITLPETSFAGGKNYKERNCYCGVFEFASFTILFIGIGVGEIFYKRRQDEINRKKEEELKQNAKKRGRRRPAAADTKIQETADGIKIDVPNGREGTITAPHTPSSASKTSFASFFK